MRFPKQISTCSFLFRHFQIFNVAYIPRFRCQHEGDLVVNVRKGRSAESGP
jgi:hypothetical protein